MDPASVALIIAAIAQLSAEIGRLVARAQDPAPLSDEERVAIVARTLSFPDRQPPEGA